MRLFDALITKCEVLPNDFVAPEFSIEKLKTFRDEEYKHFLIVRDALKSLGADPTAITPCADVDAVASMGLVQVMNDPRTSVAQCLDALLIAELADNDGWQMLIELTAAMGLNKLIPVFQQAKLEEDKHLQSVRDWLTHNTIVEEARAA